MLINDYLNKISTPEWLNNENLCIELKDSYPDALVGHFNQALIENNPSTNTIGKHLFHRKLKELLDAGTEKNLSDLLATC